jgi:hypothetical protein
MDDLDPDESTAVASYRVSGLAGSAILLSSQAALDHAPISSKGYQSPSESSSHKNEHRKPDNIAREKLSFNTSSFPERTNYVFVNGDDVLSSLLQSPNAQRKSL